MNEKVWNLIKCWNGLKLIILCLSPSQDWNKRFQNKIYSVPQCFKSAPNIISVKIVPTWNFQVQVNLICWWYYRCTTGIFQTTSDFQGPLDYSHWEFHSTYQYMLYYMAYHIPWSSSFEHRQLNFPISREGLMTTFWANEWLKSL